MLECQRANRRVCRIPRLACLTRSRRYHSHDIISAIGLMCPRISSRREGENLPNIHVRSHEHHGFSERQIGSSAVSCCAISVCMLYSLKNPIRLITPHAISGYWRAPEALGDILTLGLGQCATLHGSNQLAYEGLTSGHNP
jgi:hypothetical protein